MIQEFQKFLMYNIHILSCNNMKYALRQKRGQVAKIQENDNKTKLKIHILELL